MSSGSNLVVGREAELDGIARFVARVPSGPQALLIEGDAGIGKTTLWQAGVDEADRQGLRVLVTRADQTETKLSFAGLGDLLEPVADEGLDALPGPQRAALEVALLRSEEIAPDQRAVSMAALGVLRSVTKTAPLVLAVDDLQWLDDSSAAVLSFAAKRLRAEPLGIIASLRLGERRGDLLSLDRVFPREQVDHLRVGPMPTDAIERLISQRLGPTLPHPILRRVGELAAGNPFFALEIGRELIRRGLPQAGEEIPVPDDLRDLLKARIGSLPDDVRTVLLVAAATRTPTEDLLTAAANLGSKTAPAIEEAERSGVVSVDGGRIRFAHPLLASTAYSVASSGARREAHRRLAEHVNDPEESARHLALASTGPDERVAAILEGAARVARARGAPGSAADLAELARGATPVDDGEAFRRRSVQAAGHHFDSGDAARAWALLDEVVAQAPPGRDRAIVLYRLATISWMDMARVQRLCEQAREEAGNSMELLAAIHEHLAWVAIYRGDLSAASEQAAEAMRSAGLIDDLAITADVTSTYGMVEFLRGRPAEAFMQEAERLDDAGTIEGIAGPGIQASVYTAARTCHGLQLLWAGRLSAARETLLGVLHGYEERGRYLFRDEILVYLAELECRAGDLELARRYAEEAHEIEVESGRVLGQGHTLFPRALVAAHRGEAAAARSYSAEGLSRCVQNEDLLDANCHRAVLGFLELSLSDPSAAIEHLEPVTDFLRRMGSPESSIIPAVPDAIEALTLLGRLDEAGSLLAEHQERASAMARPWETATSGRCRGLLLAARGEHTAALDALGGALEAHGDVLQPLEHARTLLVTGEVQRRAKQKVAARSSLERAGEIFDGIGSRLWSDRAASALSRVGGGAARTGELTPTERRITDLVVQGKTNREIADALFISIKTVESNLSRVFHKLGVRSRVELARRALGTERREDSNA